MRLDALDNVAIGLGDLDRRLDVDAVRSVEARIIVPLQSADDIGRKEGEPFVAGSARRMLNLR